ncbi:MAG: hypothetical protein R6V57_17340, partial [Vicinamibacterales bacterium]
MPRGRSRGIALVAVVALAALCAPVAPLTAQKPQLGYYRQPAILNDTLVFVADTPEVALGHEHERVVPDGRLAIVAELRLLGGERGHRRTERRQG